MASIENQFFLDASAQSEEWLDFDQFLDLTPSYSDDYSASATSISPDMSIAYEADMFANNLPSLTQTGFPDMINYDLSNDGFFADQSPNMGLMHDPAPIFDDATFNGYQPYDTTFDFRQMVEAQAAADPRVASIKEKRREAAIALHLQRLCDKTALDLDMSSDSNTSFSSPCWSEYMRESISPQPASSASPEQASAPPPSANGGMEMVLDLNMNATTNGPKKQKPRSQAQKENYIKARKYGACEKHKKQHKRCNCLEKAAAAGVSNRLCDVPMDVAYRERVQLPSPNISAVPSPRQSGVGVPGNHRPVSVPDVQPMVNGIKRVTSHSPVNSPSNPTVVQPTIKTKTRTISNSPGHDPQYSATFVLSPTADAGKASNSVGRDSHTSRAQASEASVKKAGLPTWRGCALGLSSGNRHTDAFSRHIATTFSRSISTETAITDVKQTIAVAHGNSRKPDGRKPSSSHVLEVIDRRPRNLHVAQDSKATTAVQQKSINSPKAREGLPSGLEVHRPKRHVGSQQSPRTKSAIATSWHQDSEMGEPTFSPIRRSLQRSLHTAGLSQTTTSRLCPNSRKSSSQSQDAVRLRSVSNVVASSSLNSVMSREVSSFITQTVGAFAQTVGSFCGLLFDGPQLSASNKAVSVPHRVSDETASSWDLLMAYGLRKVSLLGNVGMAIVRLI